MSCLSLYGTVHTPLAEGFRKHGDIRKDPSKGTGMLPFLLLFSLFPDKPRQVGEELADVVCYALALANELGIDVSAALSDKMEKNRRKYPAGEYRGRFGPDDPGGGQAN